MRTKNINQITIYKIKMVTVCCVLHLNLPQLQHIDHVKVDHVKYFHGLIITNRAEKSSFSADSNAFYHTYTQQSKNSKYIKKNSFSPV